MRIRRQGTVITHPTDIMEYFQNIYGSLPLHYNPHNHNHRLFSPNVTGIDKLSSIFKSSKVTLLTTQKMLSYLGEEHMLLLDNKLSDFRE